MPRESGRLYPDAPQAGIGGATVINQSRVTFSGAEGLVVLVFVVTVTNAAAVAVPGVFSTFVGSQVLALGFQGVGHLPAVAGDSVHLIAMALVRNPTPGAFVEISVNTTGGTVDVAQNAGGSLILSYDAEDLGGPVVTVV